MKQGVWFPTYDGNGNVSELLTTAGTTAAHYEYGPFGEVLAAAGPAAPANPWRFSTKYQDEETALTYYGYRYYDLFSGRWLSTDPISERGGINLYAMTKNDAIQFVDMLGLEQIKVGHCEIVVALGHANLGYDGPPHNFTYKSQCSASAYIGCKPGLVNTDSRTLSGAPTHQEYSFVDPPGGEPDERFKTYTDNQAEYGIRNQLKDELSNVIKSIPGKVKELCAKCCKSVTIKMRRVGRDGSQVEDLMNSKNNNAWTRNGRDKQNDWTYQCPSSMRQ